MSKDERIVALGRRAAAEIATCRKPVK